MPPLPVALQHGRYVFVHPHGYSNAVTVNGRRHYARDYKQFAGVDVADDMTPVEPSGREFVEAMGW